MHYEFFSVNLDKFLQSLRKRWPHTKHFVHLELKDKLAKEMAAKDASYNAIVFHAGFYTTCAYLVVRSLIPLELI